MSYYDYDDYYGIAQEDLKEEYHFVLDELLDKIVENKLQDRVADIEDIREKQKKYNEDLKEYDRIDAEKRKEIRDLQNKIEKMEKEHQEELDRYKNEKFSDVFKDFIEIKGNSVEKKRIYYISYHSSSCSCPYCNDKGYIKKEIDGDIAKIECKICDSGHHKIDYKYETVEWTKSYRFGFTDRLTPCIFIDEFYNHKTLLLSEVYFSEEECKKIVKEKNAKNEKKALEQYQQRIDNLNAKKKG